MAIKKNRLGIWMDHSQANLITCDNGAIPVKTIYNTRMHIAKEQALSKVKEVVHIGTHKHQNTFFKDLQDEIILYSDVILFGPTDDKMELFNMLRADIRFDRITIEVAAAEKMTDSQKNAFIKSHFMNR